MNEFRIEIIMIDGIIFGFLFSEYEDNVKEVVLAMSFFGLRFVWR